MPQRPTRRCDITNPHGCRNADNLIVANQATIQTYLSFLRCLAMWMGRPIFVRGSAHYGLILQEYQRHQDAQRDKRWSAQGIASDELLAQECAYDPRVGASLKALLRHEGRLHLEIYRRAGRTFVARGRSAAPRAPGFHQLYGRFRLSRRQEWSRLPDGIEGLRGRG